MKKINFLLLIIVFFALVPLSSVIAQEKNDSIKSVWDKTEITAPKNIDFTIQTCEISGNIVEYTFFIRNNIKDCERFELGPYTVYDDKGNQYDNITVHLGKSSSSTNYVYEELPEGINVKVKIIIKGVDKEAKTFQRIDIGCYGIDLGMSAKKIIIKNIPIEEKKK